MRVTIQLPAQTKDFEEKSREQTLFVLKLIEKLVAYNPAPKVYEMLVSKRLQYEAQSEETEEKKKEAEEKNRLEKEKKLQAMDPEKRRKLEEKRNKTKGVKKMKIK